MNNKMLVEELGNIVCNQPVFPGCTISHETANECVSRGWAKRDHIGDFISTHLGELVLIGFSGSDKHAAYMH